MRLHRLAVRITKRTHTGGIAVGSFIRSLTWAAHNASFTLHKAALIKLGNAHHKAAAQQRMNLNTLSIVTKLAVLSEKTRYHKKCGDLSAQFEQNIKAIQDQHTKEHDKHTAKLAEITAGLTETQDAFDAHQYSDLAV